MNYEDHTKEMGKSSMPPVPVVFQKPYSCVVDGEPIILPRAHSRDVHHEIELGVIIGKECRDFKGGNWLDFVGGYFLALDLTDRELQSQAKTKGEPWWLSKGQDNFLCVSKDILEPKGVNPHSVELQLLKNGKEVQRGSTKDMHFKIPAILEYLSSFVTLNEGDLILTGTPSGVGPIREGDKLVGTISSNDKEVLRFSFDVKRESK